MLRSLAIGVVLIVAIPSLAGAQDASGKYIVTQPRHKGRVNKIEALTLKQKVMRSDTDRPVTLGTVPNPKAKKKGSGQSPSDRRLWKSRSGHTIP